MQSPIDANSYAEAGSPSKVRLELTDGRQVTVYSSRVVSDTLRGQCAATGSARSAVLNDDSPHDSCAFALRDVRGAEVRQLDGGRAAILLGIPVALLLVLFRDLARR